MKRERLNLGEVSMNVDVLLPYVENMLKTRQDAIEKVNTERNNDPSIVYDTTYGIGASLSIGYRFMFMGVYLEQDLEGIFGEKDFADSRFLGGTYLTFRVIGTFNTIELEAGFGLGAMYMASTQPDIMIDCDGHAESAASFAMKFTIGATARFGEVGISLHLDYDLGINPHKHESIADRK